MYLTYEEVLFTQQMVNFGENKKYIENCNLDSFMYKNIINCIYIAFLF